MRKHFRFHNTVKLQIRAIIMHSWQWNKMHQEAADQKDTHSVTN